MSILHNLVFTSAYLGILYAIQSPSYYKNYLFSVMIASDLKRFYNDVKLMRLKEELKSDYYSKILEDFKKIDEEKCIYKELKAKEASSKFL